MSSEIDQSVRMFLASQAGARKGDLSRFIEEAVRTHIFEHSAVQAKETMADVRGEKLTALVDDAIDWARQH